MKSFLIALQFLTIMPVKLKSEVTESDLARSAAYFPVVGFLTGAVLAFFYNVFGFIFPNAVTCAFIVILNIFISGGLHIDGFIDTIDGIASGGDREKMLRIMREGRPGAVGLAGVALLFLAQYSLLVSLPGAAVEVSLIMMTSLSRWSLVIASFFYRSARPADGLGPKFIGRIKPAVVITATLVVLFCSAVAFGFRTFILIPIVFCAIAVFNMAISRKIGGLTGDTLGALNEFTEVLVLATIIALR